SLVNSHAGVPSTIGLGDGGWPITYDELLPYIARAKAFLGVTNADHAFSHKELSQSGFDFGVDLEVSRHIWLRTPDFITLFGRELLESNRLLIATNIDLRNLHFAGDRVCAVTSRTSSGKTETFMPRHVVLANGTLELVRVILRSAATDPACPFRRNRH